MQFFIIQALLFITIVTVINSVSIWHSEFKTNEYCRHNYLNKYVLSVFQSPGRANRFYFTPLLLLDHSRYKLINNTLTGRVELRFQVIMWNTQMRKNVENKLQSLNNTNPEVKMLPMEKARFLWKSRAPMSPDYTLDDTYFSTNEQPLNSTILFICNDWLACTRLADHVTKSPISLDRLSLEFYVMSQKSETKRITVTINHVMNSSTYAKLRNMKPDKNYWYMRSEDLNRLAHQAFSSVRASTVKSSEYVEESSEIGLVSMIERALKQDEIVSNTLTERQWSSVFWEPAYARPDKIVREANRMFYRDGDSNRLRLNVTAFRERQERRRLTSDIGGSVSMNPRVEIPSLVALQNKYTVSGYVKREGENNTISRDRDTLSKDEANDLLRERGAEFEWNGEKFVVKPMRLSRLNAQTLLRRHELVSDSVQLNNHPSTYSLKVRVSNGDDFPTDKLTAGVNEFPVDYSYCLLSNGGYCPPGFIRSSGFIKAMSIDTSEKDMIQKAEFGDSAIRCHSPNGANDCQFTAWHPYKAELHLHTCCR